MVTSDFRPEVEIRSYCACAMKNMQHNPYLLPICGNFRILQEIGVEEHDVMSDLKIVEMEIWLFCACVMHPAIIIGTVRSLWTWLWGRYHFPQNIFLVFVI